MKKLLALFLAFSMIFSSVAAIADINVDIELFDDKTVAETVYAKNVVTLPVAVNGVITLTENIEISETFVINEGEELTIDLNDYTITGTLHKSNGAVINNKGTLTLKNGTVTSAADNGGSALMNSGTAVVENTTLNGAPNADGSWPSYTVNNSGTLTLNNSDITSYHGAVASYNTNAVVYLNNTNINMTGIPGFTNHGIYVYDSGAAVVTGGNIANNAKDQASTGGSVINGAVTVYGGNFTGRIENYYGNPVLYGGTYTVKPNEKYIATEGKEVKENADGTFTIVSPYVSTYEELIEALA